MQLTKSQILGTLAGLAIALWILGSTALFFFIKYRKGYEAIQFSDVALPWNWDELRPKWGDYFIEKGIDFQDKGDWSQAFYFTRVGVSKSPSNLEGRLALADMLFQTNDVITAVKVLEQGLEYAVKDEEFWTKMIQFLQYYEADQEIIRILSKGMEDHLIPDSQLENAQAALAKAYYHQADFDSALEFVGKSSAISNQIIRSQIHWDQGLESLALQNLEALNAMFPNQREVIPLLTRFYEKSGEVAKAKQLARNTYLNNPYSIGAAVNYFRVLGEDAEAEIDRFLVRVPEIYDNQEALFLLTNFLAESGFHEKLDQVIEKSGPRFQDAAMVWFLRVEALVNAKAFGQAEKRLASPPHSVNQLIPLHRILFHSLSLTTYFAQGAADKGRNAMQQLFVSGHIRPATLLRLTKKLIEINRPAEASKVLQFLLKQNPGNQAALAEKIRIELMTGNTELAIEQGRSMVENRTMPFELKKELITHLASDSQLFHKEAGILIDQMLQTMTPTKKKELLEIL